MKNNITKTMLLKQLSDIQKQIESLNEERETENNFARARAKLRELQEKRNLKKKTNVQIVIKPDCFILKQFVTIDQQLLPILKEKATLVASSNTSYYKTYNVSFLQSVEGYRIILNDFKPGLTFSLSETFNEFLETKTFYSVCVYPDRSFIGLSFSK